MGAFMDMANDWNSPQSNEKDLKDLHEHIITAKAGEDKTLGELNPGSLFMYNGRLVFKSEYATNGRPDCYIYGSGECFHAFGADLESLMVQEVIITI